MRSLLLIMIAAFLFIACHTYAQSTTKVIEIGRIKYGSATLGSKGWGGPFVILYSKKFYTEFNSDTLYEFAYDSLGRMIDSETIKYIRVSADELKTFNEPKQLHGFSFIGIYIEPKNIPGFYIVTYGKAGKGVFRKFCYAPGAVFFYDYSSVNSINPFKNDSLPQSNTYHVKINITDTIHIDTIHLQGITPEEFEKDLRKRGDSSKHIYKVDTLFGKKY